MATDYDAPRKKDDDTATGAIDVLTTRYGGQPSAVIDMEEVELAEGYELPGADLSGEELQIEILPAQADEFTCSSCFLVRHRSQLAREMDGQLFCKDCEG